MTGRKAASGSSPFLALERADRQHPAGGFDSSADLSVVEAARVARAGHRRFSAPRTS